MAPPQGPNGVSSRYWHGNMPRSALVDFLEKWRTTEHPPTKKGRQRGELMQIRGALRAGYPGWQTTMKTLRDALESRPDWKDWADELMSERHGKLEVRRSRKDARKAARETGPEAGSSYLTADEALCV